MSLISTSEPSKTTWEPIQDATLELRHGCEELEQSLEQIFCEVDEMRQDLVDRILEVEQERLQWESRDAELCQQTDEARQLKSELKRNADALAQARLELESAQRELKQQRGDAMVTQEAADMELRSELGSAIERLKTQRQELETTRLERDELQQRLSDWQAENARLAALEAQLSDAQNPVGNDVAETGPAADIETTDCAVTITVERVSALEQERDALEAELELVRNHAAELNETVVEQQRELTEQKSELGDELQQLRRLVEKQADLFAPRDGDGALSRPAEAAPPAEESPSANDPVVHSVMAQFAKLQKDVAQRRRHQQ